MSAGTGCVDEQWREALHPAVDRDVIDLDAPLGQQFFHVAVGEPVTQIPTNRNHDPSGAKRNPEKLDLDADTRRRRRRINQACPILSSADATDPSRPPGSRWANFRSAVVSFSGRRCCGSMTKNLFFDPDGGRLGGAHRASAGLSDSRSRAAAWSPLVEN